MSTAYLWHNYGKTTIGARSDIENVPIERLQAFYKRYYQPDNAVLLVAGKFDEAEDARARPQVLLRRSRSPRARWNGSTPSSRRRTASAPSRCGASATRSWSAAVYHVPSGAHPDFAAVDIISQVLGDTPSGRLHKALVETKKASQHLRLQLPVA